MYQERKKKTSELCTVFYLIYALVQITVTYEVLLSLFTVNVSLLHCNTCSLSVVDFFFLCILH